MERWIVRADEINGRRGTEVSLMAENMKGAFHWAGKSSNRSDRDAEWTVKARKGGARKSVTLTVRGGDAEEAFRNAEIALNN